MTWEPDGEVGLLGDAGRVEQLDARMRTVLRRLGADAPGRAVTALATSPTRARAYLYPTPA